MYGLHDGPIPCCDASVRCMRGSAYIRKVKNGLLDELLRLVHCREDSSAGVLQRSDEVTPGDDPLTAVS